MQTFNAHSTTDDVLQGRDLSRLRVLVTGVSAGLGAETARVLAAHGAHVIGTARDLSKATSALASARAEHGGDGEIELIQLDLASLASVKACANALIGNGQPLDLVIANAGVMATPFGRTADGFETQFGTNHLGHFALVNRIAPLMRQGARLVVVSSAGHRFADVDLDDPNFERTTYDPWLAYGRSKTANVLFAVGFDERHRDRGVRATAVHPGQIRTELGRHVKDLAAMSEQINANLVAQGLEPMTTKTIPQGAATSVWAGVVARADDVGGRYCENCHVSEVVDVNPPSPAGEGVRGYALDTARADALWNKSEQLVGERFPVT